MATFVLGLDVTTYRKSTGASAVVGESPADWVLMGNIRDEQITKSTSTADITVRKADWRQLVATLKEFNVSFQMVFDPTDDDWTKINEAFLNNTTIDFRFLDGIAEATDTPVGFEGTFMVTNFSENRSLEEAVMNDVELVLSRGTTPTIYTGSVAIP